ncbi:MAG: hypothetical protein ACK5U7_16300 [Bacteroidota bacterium]|jgi:hypothetical protein
MFKVVNIRTEAAHIYCGRAGRGVAGPLGNYTPARTALAYWIWFIQPAQLDYRARFYELCVKPHKSMPEVRLGCFCVPYPCHADALAAYANARLDGHTDADACAAVQALIESL